MTKVVELHKVKILRASNPSYWYANKIGDECIVTRVPIAKATWRQDSSWTVQIVPTGTFDTYPTVKQYLEDGDFVILETFKGRINESVTVTIERVLEKMVYNFSMDAINSVRKALADDAAGNKQCTMADLDSAVKMLDELVLLKQREELAFNLP